MCIGMGVEVWVCRYGNVGMGNVGVGNRCCLWVWTDLTSEL